MVTFRIFWPSRRPSLEKISPVRPVRFSVADNISMHRSDSGTASGLSAPFFPLRRGPGIVHTLALRSISVQIVIIFDHPRRTLVLDRRPGTRAAILRPEIHRHGSHGCSDRRCSVRAFDDSTAKRSAAAVSRGPRLDASRTTGSSTGLLQGPAPSVSAVRRTAEVGRADPGLVARVSLSTLSGPKSAAGA